MTADQEREAIKKMIADHTAEMVAGGPEVCRHWLIEHGFYHEDGRLMPQYGGEE